MIRSMTGYGKAEGSLEIGRVTIELMSVNHRNLDIRLRLPDPVRFLEIDLRGILKSELKRGHIEGGIKITADPSAPFGSPHLNRPIARLYFEEAKRFYRLLDIQGIPDPSWILSKPDVWESAESLENDRIRKPFLSVFSNAVRHLVHSREAEGSSLMAFLERKLHETIPLLERVQALKDQVPRIAQESLEKRLRELRLDPSLNPDRLSQEVIYLAQRADISEEVSRLNAHITTFGKKLREQEVTGRELDFIVQEMNREVNTMGSKSISYELSSLTIQLKKIINQIREQVQNVE